MKHFLSVLAFMGITFAVQGLNHFVLNADHYAAISFARPEPVMALGFLTMIVQGTIISLALHRMTPVGPGMKDGLTVSLGFGLFLGTYIAVTEPAKYAAPSIPAWMMIEGLASATQFLLFGLILAWIHRRFGRAVT